MMDERKKNVLHAIIKDYVSTAEPVGSRTIAKKYDLGVSPATIRNEMSDLEELGYIEQPHTSAGRIPSDKGYRYYVDCLMEKEKLNHKEQNFISQNFQRKITELDQIMHQTCHLLSQLTNYTALIVVPQVSKGHLDKIQLIPISPFKVLVVIITDNGFVNHRVLELPDFIEPQHLSALGEFLDQKLHGLNMEQVNRTLLRELCMQMSERKQLMHVALELMEQALLQRREERVFLGGALNMFNQPEFRDVSKIQALLAILEEDEIVKKLLQKNMARGLDISIGGEMPYQGVSECSMITATFHVNGRPGGSVGVLGPTRMTYSKAVSLVEYITEQLSEALSQMFKK